MGLTTRKNYRRLLYFNTLMIVSLGAAVAGWGLFWMFPEGLGESYSAIHAAVQVIRKALFWKVVIIYTVVSLLIVLGIVVLHLFYSHRIAGPTYRLGREAARIARGDLTGNIRFRQKDNLTDMADLLNDMAYRYRGRIDALKDHLAVLDTQVKTVSALIQKGADGFALKRSEEEITNSEKKIDNSLSEIRT